MEIIPITWFLLFTTGSRRISFSVNFLQMSLISVLAVIVNTGEDIHSLTGTVAGFFPWATARQQMSRSVMTPISSGVSFDLMTGISPQSWVAIRLATRSSFVVGSQVTGFLVIMSCTFIVYPPLGIFIELLFFILRRSCTAETNISCSIGKRILLRLKHRMKV